jgi:hypothetical protein
MGNKYNVWAFLLVTVLKNSYISPPMIINIKTVCDIFFVFQLWHQKKSLETAGQGYS